MQDKTEAHRTSAQISYVNATFIFMLYHFYLLSSFYFLVSVEVVLDAELSLYLFSPHFYKITVKNICLWWECLKQICTFFSFFKLTMKHQERTHVWDNVYSQQKSQNHREDQTNVFKSFFSCTSTFSDCVFHALTCSVKSVPTGQDDSSADLILRHLVCLLQEK